ncbi:MAG: hypothetical protein PHN78_06165, partial [Dehalococcoidales bacterium]|nr:hypothetical protein [Dehalococcoidales bacterium]
EGTFTGDLGTEDGFYQMEVSGTSAPLEIVYVGGAFGYLPKLAINGNWSFVLRETRRKVVGYEGTFEAWLVFIPDAQGHIVQIVDSSIELAGTRFVDSASGSTGTKFNIKHKNNGHDEDD